MFTGIIETLAKVEKIEKENSNVHFTFSSAITNELKIDQSIAHNGVCLTVVRIEGDNYTVTAIDETLKRTNLSDLNLGSLVNLERCMPANGRFDGHIVQGHVDATGICKEVKNLNGSWEFVFEHEKNKTNITVEKGSITINGVSLTVVKSTETTFSVHIIPYTFENTNFNTFKPGSKINLEFDVIGKYVAKLLGKN
ncbi:riboflavin synthase [Aurantibacillus circumpalustris]|uniref:riboflavin synthase n=1 Tax=Aurantibacillus circumpalustris TaxID=3036359 RepID=UPI00295A9346|nr:riboflavin synthase [Aurantibacillus circumpalustris]